MSSFSSAFTLVVFILVIIAVILLATSPVKLRLPCLGREIPLTFSYPPVLGVLLLLCTQALSLESLKAGIKGNKQIQPYGIVILFMSLAYLCISLDATGVFSWLSLKITNLTRGSGLALFFAYFGLSSAITLVTSNDIVIMTLTPIICYFAQATGADPVPYLIAEFTAANLWSMALFVGNPTNIIVAEAYGMTFLGYSKWMVLPTIGAGAACLAVLLLTFHRRLPVRLALPSVEPGSMLVDRVGAVLGSSILMACLGLLAAAPSLGWPLWPITLGFAGAQALYNLVAYVLLRHARIKTAGHDPGFALQLGHVSLAVVDVASFRPVALEDQEEAAGSRSRQQQQQQDLKPREETQNGHGSTVEASNIHVDTRGMGDPAREEDGYTTQRTEGSDGLRALHRGSTSTWDVEGSAHEPGQDVPDTALRPPPPPSFLGILQSMPWEIVPFVLAMFVLVEGLAAAGWVDHAAEALGAASGSLAATIASAGVASVLLANVLNNQPMTILLTRVCLSGRYAAAAGRRRQLAALFAVVVGSNLGANFTLVGALAGIMWARILEKKGITITYLGFLRLAGPVGLASTLAALLLLYLEFAFMM